MYLGGIDVDPSGAEDFRMLTNVRRTVREPPPMTTRAYAAENKLRAASEAGAVPVHGPYRVKWIGAGVWAGIADELPSELEGKD
jgi:hypothetical protein